MVTTQEGFTFFFFRKVEKFCRIFVKYSESYMSSELANLNSFWYQYKSFYYQKPCLLTKKITEIVPATEYESQQECNMKTRLVIMVQFAQKQMIDFIKVHIFISLSKTRFQMSQMTETSERKVFSCHNASVVWFCNKYSIFQLHNFLCQVGNTDIE